MEPSHLQKGQTCKYVSKNTYMIARLRESKSNYRFYQIREKRHDLTFEKWKDRILQWSTAMEGWYLYLLYFSSLSRLVNLRILLETFVSLLHTFSDSDFKCVYFHSHTFIHNLIVIIYSSYSNSFVIWLQFACDFFFNFTTVCIKYCLQGRNIVSFFLTESKAKKMIEQTLSTFLTLIYGHAYIAHTVWSVVPIKSNTPRTVHLNATMKHVDRFIHKQNSQPQNEPLVSGNWRKWHHLATA